MSVAGLRFSPDHGARATDPAETRSGSYIYGGDPAGFHDWEFRTKLRLRMYEEFLRTKKTAKRTVKEEGEEEDLQKLRRPRRLLGTRGRSSRTRRTSGRCVLGGP